jgi:hypothetical protein
VQGIRQAETTAAYDVQAHAGSLGIPAGTGVVVGGENPYTTVAAKRQENFKNRATMDDPQDVLPSLDYRVADHPHHVARLRNHGTGLPGRRARPEALY